MELSAGYRTESHGRDFACSQQWRYDIWFSAKFWLISSMPPYQVCTVLQCVMSQQKNCVLWTVHKCPCVCVCVLCVCVLCVYVYVCRLHVWGLTLVEHDIVGWCYTVRSAPQLLPTVGLNLTHKSTPINTVGLNLISYTPTLAVLCPFWATFKILHD